MRYALVSEVGFEPTIFGYEPDGDGLSPTLIYFMEVGATMSSCSPRRRCHTVNCVRNRKNRKVCNV